MNRATHTLAELQEAADAGEGFCLQCGARQEFWEPRSWKGICDECFYPEVLPAEVLLRAVSLIEDFEAGMASLD